MALRSRCLRLLHAVHLSLPPWLSGLTTWQVVAFFTEHKSSKGSTLQPHLWLELIKVSSTATAMQPTVAAVPMGSGMAPQQPGGSILLLLEKPTASTTVGVSFASNTGKTWVQQVAPNGLSQMAGLQPGMTIVSINGTAVRSATHGTDLIKAAVVGKVEIVVQSTQPMGGMAERGVESLQMSR